LWFTESIRNTIGRITPDGGITEFPVPSESGAPEQIVLGPDEALWFTGTVGETIWRVSATGEFTPFPTGLPLRGGILVGPDAALWFTTRDTVLGRLTLEGEVSQVPLDLNPFLGMALGPDGAIWLAGGASGKLVRVLADGAVYVYRGSVPGQRSFTLGVVAMDDGSVWYTDYDANVVGHLNPDAALVDCRGFVTDVTVPDGTRVAPGQVLEKVWRVRNCGTTIWDSYQAVRVRGNLGPPSFSVPKTAPGETAQLAVQVTAAQAAGCQLGEYVLEGPHGQFDGGFGVAVIVDVPGSTPGAGTTTRCP